MTLPLSSQDALALANQMTQDELIFNALNPGASAPLISAITWGGETFAEYTLTSNAGSLARYLPTPTSVGDVDAFITGVFGNSLGRVPAASDISFYEHVVTAAPTAFQGFADIVLFVGLSPESYHHNQGLGIVVT